jgi:glutamine amidotransferase
LCELFGFSGADQLDLSPALRTFFSHSVRHPHGWGLAVQDQGRLQVSKEAVRAMDSPRLRQRLEVPLETDLALGHIRFATIGQPAWRNCHPYCARDLSGRHWTLIHNGTIFSFPPMDPFYSLTDSDTDSACMLSYILSQINGAFRAKKQPLTAQERFAILDEILVALSPKNKVNLLLYDGELLYVHSNYRNSLYQRHLPQGTLFSTQPLEETGWQPVPFTQLLAYQAGVPVFQGTCHGAEYQDDPAQLRLLFLASAEL